eukprot:3522582-Rhodomonas_salina.1
MPESPLLDPPAVPPSLLLFRLRFPQPQKHPFCLTPLSILIPPPLSSSIPPHPPHCLHLHLQHYLVFSAFRFCLITK